MYGLIFSYNPTTQQVSLVSGSPVYQSSVAVHTLTLQADLVLGNVVTATFYLGGQAVTQGLTMAKTLNEPIWTLPLPDLVTHTAGTYTVAFAILQPVVTAGATIYRVLTTANQTFTVITSIAQQAVATVTPTEAENLQGQIDTLDQTLIDEQARLTALVDGLAPFIGENEHWYVYDSTTGTMIDSGVKASGQKIVSCTKTATAGLVDTWTLTFDDGATETFTVTNGKAATVSVGTTQTGAEGTNASVTNVGTDNAAVFDFLIPRGNTGATGNGIQTIVLTSTIGRAKTYTITYTDGTTTTFTVLDGKSFYIAKTYASIAEMNADYNNPQVEVGDFVLIASGINDPDNAKMYVKGSSAYEYVTDLSGATGIQGVGISSVTKTGTSDLVDTYTITYTDGSTSTFTVTNGKAATVSVGTTTTGVAGSSASVKNSGTSGAAVFNFTIPQGAQGIQGDKGDTSTIAIGTTTTGNAGTDAQVTDTGTATDAIFNFVIPRGDTGASLRYKGTYSAQTAYVNNTDYIDVVSSNGTSYICLQSSTGQLVSDGAYWAVLALKGADGESFSISYVFPSIAAMNAAYDQFDIGDFVLINTGSVEDEDTGKLYIKGSTQWDYLTDMSGVQGIQGVGIATIAKTSTSGLVDTYTITLTDNTTSSFTVTNGQSGTGAGNVIATNVSVANVVYAYRGATIDDNGNITGQLVTLAEGGIQTVLTFDTTPTAGSVNPVTSNGIKVALDAKQNTLTFDQTPTDGSSNPVTSGGVKTALDGKQNTLSFDTAPTAGSNNPVTSNGVFDALNGKQNTLSFDAVPTDGSNNPVTSNGVYDGLATKQAKNLNFADTVIAINGFVADATYADFPFRATVPLTGVTASMVASVVLSLADATSGKFAPVCDTYAGGVYLYSTETNAVAITIPTIVVGVV